MAPKPTPGAKMMYLIKRRTATSREELIAHWFKNHMPGVIAAQDTADANDRPHAHRYIATLFEPAADGTQAWDGVAQLWWDDALRSPSQPHGSEPRDTFQQKVEPYVPWATTEYVVVDGALPVEPNTLNEPFPCTRSGFSKLTALIVAKPGTDYDAFYTHWLTTHADNVANVMIEVGAYRYVISHSNHPTAEPYAGMAELYFPDTESFKRYQKIFQPDGMDEWVDRTTSETLWSGTEMIGIA